MPPRNSEKLAAHAKNAGRGKPIFPAPSINPAEGGILPRPWPSASDNPANMRNIATPALASGDSPDSPPNSIFFSIRLSPTQISFCVERMAQFRRKDNKRTGFEGQHRFTACVCF
jgi:hypothetical protein